MVDECLRTDLNPAWLGACCLLGKFITSHESPILCVQMRLSRAAVNHDENPEHRGLLYQVPHTTTPPAPLLCGQRGREELLTNEVGSLD